MLLLLLLPLLLLRLLLLPLLCVFVGRNKPHVPEPAEGLLHGADVRCCRRS